MGRGRSPAWLLRPVCRTATSGGRRHPRRWQVQWQTGTVRSFERKAARVIIGQPQVMTET